MTFIASVVARNGVAIIADSLVTTSRPVLEFDEFISYLDTKIKKSKNQKIKVDPKEVVDLFVPRPSHTKDYEEKLFKYDKYTAITTAGSASICDKRIIDVVNEIKVKLQNNSRSYSSKKIETKINEFCKELTEYVKKHLNEKTSIRPTTLIITNYNKKTKKTRIFKILIKSASQKNLKDSGFEFVKLSEQPENYTVVCDGQNRISEKILFGDFDAILSIVPRMLNQIMIDFNIKTEDLPKNYLMDLLKNKDILTSQFFDDMKMYKLTELSLQQAVDLAALLMKIEIDMQKYTENIPTVGGVIKLAIIDNEGFEFISGKKIVKPENILY